MSLLRKLAFPISLLYALVVYLRNQLFDIGFFKSRSFQTPTICVGNLSVGGTGKTPMIEYLIRCLREENIVAVLSRGYKRKSKGYILASEKSTVEDLGDEPYQIHSKYAQVAVAVDADRCNGITQLEKELKPDVILLDDAFQHRKVKADLNILLTSYNNLYSDDWYLPTGNLRDSKSQVKRANYIVVTKCPQNISKEERTTIKAKLAYNDNQTVLFSYLKYDSELKSAESILSFNLLKGEPFTLVTGIANPMPLVQYLTDKSMSFEHLAFKDHHFFTTQEIQKFNTKDVIVTTEKDFVRLKGKVDNLYYLEVSHAFIEDDEAKLKKGLANFMKRNS